MTLTILTGLAHPGLAQAIANGLGVVPVARELHRFPDGELQVELTESVRGHDVYLIQPTAPPVESNIFELLLLADACRRAGAARLTAVIPYFGYARQDRRARGREPVAARLVADLFPVSGVQRIVAVDLHSRALEGVVGIPLEHLSAVPTLAAVIRCRAPPAEVVVAPDLGAVKLAEHYAEILSLPVAIVHKSRVSGTTVKVRGVTGDVRGRRPLLVDDMISTGGTIAAAAEALMTAGSASDISVAATHGPLLPDAIARLRDAEVERAAVTDSVAVGGLPSSFEVVTLAPLLAEAVRRLHTDRSLADLIAHG